jgi:thiol-disulfide isomerase/thioredoxin
MIRSTPIRWYFCFGVIAAGGLLIVPSTAFTASSLPFISNRGSDGRTATTIRRPYSNTVENPLDENRVKQLAEETAAKRPKLPNLHTALTVRDFDKLVASEQGSDCVVRYYAPWCKACKKSEPLFLKLAQDHPGVKFIQVPILSSNSELVARMGVTIIPWGQIYRPQLGLVQEFKINSKNFAEFRSVVAALS